MLFIKPTEVNYMKKLETDIKKYNELKKEIYYK